MIDGFSISGYRSFGPEEVKISDLSRLNVFIGKNNCGKSNVLRFLKRIGDTLRGEIQKLDPLLDYCRGDAKKSISFGVQISRTGPTGTYQRINELLSSVRPTIESGLGDGFWIHYALQTSGQAQPQTGELEAFLKAHFSDPEVVNLADRICGSAGGRDVNARRAQLASRVHTEAGQGPDVRFIDAFRKISSQGGDQSSGAGLIRALRDLQAPTYNKYEESRETFARLVNFIRSVLGSSDARLEIPASVDDVYVVIDNKTLPLASLGSGIHEVVIMAAAVTLISEAVVCIEEPEIHCHPELQKKFARYLLDHTTNQYLFASHSNAFLDLQDANTYRCWLNDSGYTQCELAAKSSEKHVLLLDLGYKPSDLLQANYVIWVEGPSDRIYIKHWLRAKGPELVEGLHYSIMFYGGKLLAHLSYDSDFSDDDSVVTDFIRLAHLNRSACIVMDSDRPLADASLNRTKVRLMEEFERGSCLAWVTQGRTIENYVQGALLNQAIAEVHSRTKKELVWEQFGDLTKITEDKTIDKVAVARSVARAEADFSVLDLESQVDRLVASIRLHNS